MLNDTNIKSTYTAEEDDFFEDFLKPAFENSTSYSRIAGHFSSSVFEIYYESLEKFINNAKSSKQDKIPMRLIISHKISNEKDAITANEAYENKKNREDIERDLKFTIESFLDSEERLDRFKLFAYLIEHSLLEVKVGVFKKNQDVHHTNYLHDKTGIFSDGENTVSFRGGVNESRSGYTHFDSFDTNRSWLNSEDTNEKISSHVRLFEKIWSNDSNRLNIYSLPTAIKREILKYSPSREEYRKITGRINSKEAKKEKLLSGIEPREHQERAIKIWRKNKHRAVLEYCPGAGKTIIAIKAIMEMMLKKINTLILVPNSTLLEQWVNEIEKYIPQSNILRCSGNYNWKDKLRRMTTNDREYCIIISTIQTASQKIFKDRCSDAGNLFLIADECHMLWPPVFNTVLSEIPWSDNPRLALSATPHDTTFSADLSEDYNEDEEDDEEGNARGNINPIEFFGGNKEGEAYVSNDKFTIKEAIDAGILSKYEYHVVPVYLTKEEMVDYRRFGRDVAMAIASKDKKKRQIAIAKRNKVLKIAINKRTKCLELLSSTKWGRSQLNLKNQHWLVYVGPGQTEKIDESGESKKVSEIVHLKDYLCNHLDDATINLYSYDGSIKKKAERQAMLNNFQMGGGICLACQMLDEGVDIPELSRAIVMASSENTRQYIQRRGRLLRKDKRLIDDKPPVNLIWDMMVLPNRDLLDNQDDLKFYKTIIKKECLRALEFCKDAENSKDMESQINLIRNDYVSEVYE